MLAALMMVKDEETILPFSLGHLLHTVKVDAVYIADNGSDDGTRAILKAAAKIDDRVHWMDASGPWNHGETITAIAEEARRKGATWLLPIDADEFLCSHTPLRELTSTSTGLWEIPVINFVQLNGIRYDHPGALRTMIFRAATIGTSTDAHARVGKHEIAFVQMRYPAKIMVRATPGLIIATGNHSASNFSGSISTAPEVEILHAPMRARQAVERRIINARRLTSADPGENWHLKRLLKLSKTDIDLEWHVNSVSLGRIGTSTSRRFAIPDLRLRRIAAKQATFLKAVNCDIPR